MKFSKILLSIVFLCGVVLAQNTVVKSLDFSPTYTIASGANQLPPASSNTGRIFAVTDGVNGVDCTVGGGSAPGLCKSTGSVYAPVVSAASSPTNEVSKATSFTATCGVWYLVTASSVTATLPAPPGTGCTIGIAAVAGTSSVSISPNGKTFYVNSQVAAIASLPVPAGNMSGVS